MSSHMHEGQVRRKGGMAVTSLPGTQGNEDVGQRAHLFSYREVYLPTVMAHTFYLSPRKGEAGGSL